MTERRDRSLRARDRLALPNAPRVDVFWVRDFHPSHRFLLRQSRCQALNRDGSDLIPAARIDGGRGVYKVAEPGFLLPERTASIRHSSRRADVMAVLQDAIPPTF